MSEDKSTPFLALKQLFFCLSSFYTQPSFCAQHLFSTSVTTSREFQSSGTVFKKKQNKW